nr:uncharacterized protein LOC127346741 [Lolium perenne]
MSHVSQMLHKAFHHLLVGTISTYTNKEEFDEAEMSCILAPKATADAASKPAGEEVVPWSTPARLARRRPGRSFPPAGASPPSSGRFVPLEDLDVEDECSVAEEVAWAGLQDEPEVLPIDKDLDRAALLEDFWDKIGFPVASARTWERRASPLAVAVPRARSSSPPRLEPAKFRRAISSSPPGMRIPRQSVRLKGWRGPLPPKRFTPPAVFGDFLDAAVKGARRTIGNASPPASDAVIPPRHATAASHPSSPPPLPPDRRPRSSPSSASLERAPLCRSFVDVVSKGAAGPMAGPPRSVPPGIAPAPPVPARPQVAASASAGGGYQGPPGFQGWPQGALMPPAPAAQPRPQVGFRPPQPRIPTTPFMPQQQPPYPPQQQYPQYPPQQQYAQFQGQFFPSTNPTQQPVVSQIPQQVNPPAQPGQQKKRRKKKPVAAVGTAGGGNGVPSAMLQGFMQDPQPAGVPTPVMEAVPAPLPMPIASPAVTAPVAAAPVVKPKKAGRCWKCAVNTHASKDCKVPHYYLVCDSGAHPTIRCPVLKTPRPMSFFVGCGNDATLDLQVPDSVYKPQMLSIGAPTALVQVLGEGTVAATDIQNLMARMCPGNPT